MLILSSDYSGISGIKEKLKVRFEIEDLGPARFCLGLKIDRDVDAKTVKLSQKAGAEK